MKKVMLVFFAAVMAIGMSAFTDKKTGDVFYKDAEGNPQETSATPCTEGQYSGCVVPIPELPGTPSLQLFHQNGSPYTRNVQ